MAAAEAYSLGRPLRIMFQDEARFGRLPVVRSAWAPPDTRPTIVAAIERQFKYVYGAISTVEGEIDWMLADSMKTDCMSSFLAQVSEAHPDDYIMMVVDGASSHRLKDLAVPGNIKLVSLPPYSPELNPVESPWDHVREKACANIFFDSLNDAVKKVGDEIAKLARDARKVSSMFCWRWIIRSI